MVISSYTKLNIAVNVLQTASLELLFPSISMKFNTQVNHIAVISCECFQLNIFFISTHTKSKKLENFEKNYIFFLLSKGSKVSRP